MADEPNYVGDSFPAEIKDQRDKVPGGQILFTIENVQEGMMGKEGSEVLVVIANLVAQEPASAAGISHEETFWIGRGENDPAVRDGKAQADPEAQLAETWAYRARGLKLMAHKAGVEIEGKNRQLVYSELQGRQVIGKVEHEIDKKNPQYTNARIKSWWAAGEQTPSISGDAPTQPKAAPAAGPRPGIPAPAPRTATLAAPAPAQRPPVRRLGSR